METITKRHIDREARVHSTPGITLYAQEIGLQTAIALDYPTRRQRRQAKQYRQQLLVAARGRVAVSSSLALGVFRLQQQVEEFRELPADWDTYGAEPIREAAIRQARRILHALSLQLPGRPIVSLHVFPMRDGGVQIDADRPGRAMEIEVHPDGSASYLLFTAEGELLAPQTSLTLACQQFMGQPRLT